MEHIQKCSTQVTQPGDVFGSHLCNLKVTMDHEGVPYCTRHGRKVAAKATARAEGLRANDKRNAEIAAYAAQKDEDRRKLDAFPTMLEALEGIIRNAGYENGQAEASLTALCIELSYLDTARAAIEAARS